MHSLLLRLASHRASSSATDSAKQNDAWTTSAAEQTVSGMSGQSLHANASGSLQPTIASLPETRRLVLTASLNKLFSEKHFNICTLDAILDTMQGSQRTEAYRLLRTLHCMDYAAMPRELRDCLPQLVNEALRPPETVCVATEIALQGVAL